MELQYVLMAILMCPLITAGRSLACFCPCHADCRPLLSISEADDKECVAYDFTTRIKCCSVREEDPTYDVPQCNRDFVPLGECSVCLKTARKSLKKCRCGVLEFCCGSRVAELNCSICLDLKKCFDVLGKVLPCGLKCVSKDCCLSLESGRHVEAKAWLPCCVRIQKHKHELGPNCTDQFFCEMTPLSSFGCVLDSCCVSRVTELNCNICLDLKKGEGGFGKVLPCGLKCVSEECCLSSDSGSHVDAKACPTCHVFEQDMNELQANCTDQLSCETAPLNRHIRTKENLQVILASLGLVLLLL